MSAARRAEYRERIHMQHAHIHTHVHTRTRTRAHGQGQSPTQARVCVWLGWVCVRPCLCGGCCSVAGPVMTHAMCPTQHVCSGGVSFQADRAGGGRDGQGENILLNFAGHSKDWSAAECILARADYCILILPSPSRLLLKIPNTVRFTVTPPLFVVPASAVCVSTHLRPCPLPYLTCNIQHVI